MRARCASRNFVPRGARIATDKFARKFTLDGDKRECVPEEIMQVPADPLALG